ncbi:hypothetical protein C0039_05315 [Pseudohalioglobus lutimaris]|uniref:Uncharacterized protein n=1 Tax=Pseudohalioglobus lutimaris TaxID=1737061 RepID=A0A2N5X631_9GAMM|nr:hypothetical protein C0039_05315 [Pseudohalioglobus lutimaris]
MGAGSLQQISLSLDRRIPLEAILLQRLQRLPRGRQNEWLRQLLSVGFRSECQVIKSEQILPAPDLISRAWSTRTMMEGCHPIDTDNHHSADMPSEEAKQGHAFDNTVLNPDPLPKEPVGKPFAHLRRVIGE